MGVFSSAGARAIVLLTCPKCREIQARARLAELSSYECRKCGHAFQLESEGRKRDDRDEK